MSPVITLLTDFGTRDSYVAEVKAVLLREAPAAALVDVTHELVAGDVQAAQYLLGRTWHRFPPGTVHLVVVDPGVGTARRALAVRAGQHRFVGPDNGVLTPVLDGAAAVALPIPPDAAPTFHGRDVFAPVAARLACGAAIEALGDPVRDPLRIPRAPPRVEHGVVVGQVIYIDRFGTLVTDIPADAFAAAREVTLPGGHTARAGRTFGDVAPGALVAYVGSGGTVEIAARDGSAAALAGVGVGGEVRLLTTA